MMAAHLQFIVSDLKTKHNNNFLLVSHSRHSVYDVIQNLSLRIFLIFVSFHSVVFYAWDASFSRKGGKGRSQNPDLMNKKSL